MVKRHLKTLSTPKTWDVDRKATKYVTRPLPGAHPLSMGYCIDNLLKNVLNIAMTSSEVKYLLTKKQVLVDGVKRTERKFIAGLMDVVSFPDSDKHFRILISRKGKIFSQEIGKEESALKLSKIRNKIPVKGGKIQVTTQDGRTLLVEPKDQKSFKTGDTLVLSLPDQKIKTHLSLEKGALVYLIGGRHVGIVGSVQEINSNKINFKTAEGDIFETSKDYAFVVGKDKPVILIPGVKEKPAPKSKAPAVEKKAEKVETPVEIKETVETKKASEEKVKEEEKK